MGGDLDCYFILVDFLSCVVFVVCYPTFECKCL